MVANYATMEQTKKIPLNLGVSMSNENRRK